MVDEYVSRRFDFIASVTITEVNRGKDDNHRHFDFFPATNSPFIAQWAVTPGGL